MLTRQQAISSLDGNRLIPDRLTRQRHQAYLGYAESFLEIYRQGIGWTRRQLHRAVQDVVADVADCPQRRIDAFCKLLDDVSRFDQDKAGRAAKLRQQVFRAAAANHPLVAQRDGLFDTTEAEVKQRIAAELGKPWTQIDAELFADIIELHRLREFKGYPDAASLLARYNVAQTQAALFDAIEMTLWVGQDLKSVLRYAKLARLMHDITQTAPGRYKIRFDGPASLLRQTRRYGVAMAKFLPPLLSCRAWKMHAVLRSRRAGWKFHLTLTQDDGLTSHVLPPDEFDSSVEETFAKNWEKASVGDWTMSRESEVLHQGQKVFVPDFVFRHADGRVRYMEIVGFWTPEYLSAKAETLSRFKDRDILLVVAHSVAESLPELPPKTIFYKTAIKVPEVLEQLNASSNEATS